MNKETESKKIRNSFIVNFVVSLGASPSDIQRQCEGMIFNIDSETAKNKLRSMVDPFKEYKELIGRFKYMFPDGCRGREYTRPKDVLWTGDDGFSWMVDEYYFLKGEFAGMEVILFYGCEADIGLGGLIIGVREKRKVFFDLVERRGRKKLQLSFDAVWIAKGTKNLHYDGLIVRSHTRKKPRDSIKLVDEFLKERFSSGF